MQSLSTAYTVYYNLRHDRHGHLFDGRYKAKLVDGDDYLLALSRYVHLNPVKVAGIKSKLVEEKIRYLLEYPWSSYPGYIRKRSRFDFVEYAPQIVILARTLEKGEKTPCIEELGKGLRKRAEPCFLCPAGAPPRGSCEKKEPQINRKMSKPPNYFARSIF
jgi:hypothetical protein